MKERLQKILARSGIASRRACEELILAGRVTVDGKTVTELGSSADPAVADVRLDGERIRKERPVYYVVNKPRGVVTTASDDRSRPTVLDLLSKVGRRVFPVGRLDIDTDGLLLLTNDGELAQHIAHPRHGIAKTYEVRVKGKLERQAREALERGVWLAEGRCQGVKIERVKPEKHVTVVTVTLCEGKNRELRRIFAKVGCSVVALRRIAVGPVRLGALKTGAYRLLSDDEVEALRNFENVEGAALPPPPRRSKPRATSKPRSPASTSRRPTRSMRRKGGRPGTGSTRR